MVLRRPAGDASCLGVLLDRHRAGMRAVAVALLGYGPAAEDAVVTALRRLHDVRDPEAVGAWLRGIVRNACQPVGASTVRECASPRRMSRHRNAVPLRIDWDCDPDLHFLEGARAVIEHERGGGGHDERLAAKPLTHSSTGFSSVPHQFAQDCPSRVDRRAGRSSSCRRPHVLLLPGNDRCRADHSTKASSTCCRTSSCPAVSWLPWDALSFSLGPTHQPALLMF